MVRLIYDAEKFLIRIVKYLSITEIVDKII